MKGYIQIELGGVKRGVKFGNRALLDMVAKHNLNENSVFNFDLICDLVWFGLLNNCMVNRSEPDFTNEDVIIWCDDLSNETIKEVTEIFINSYNGTLGETKPAKTTATKKK